MKTTRLLLLVAAVSALLGACSRNQPPGTPPTTNQPDSNVNAGAETVKVTGTVTDPAGNPLAGATVEYWSYTGSVLRPNALEMQKQMATMADGAFALQVSRGTGFLLARKTGLAPAWRQLNQQINSGGETDQRLALTPPTSLAGVVVDESNQPVAAAEVFVVMAVSEVTLENGARTFNYLSGKFERQLFTAHTDTAGHFRIENFPTNAAAALEIQSSGKAMRQSPPDSFSFD